MVPIRLAGRAMLHAQVWRRQVGRVPLLLLDSDVEDNAPAERDVTDRLYGGGSDHRLRQEMLLGIGGVRALRAFCRADRPRRARGLPHQRGPRRLPRRSSGSASSSRGDGADLRRGARGGPGGARCSPRTRRCPPASTGSRATWSSTTSAADNAARACRSTGSSRSAPRTYAGGDPTSSTWRVMGLRLAQRANGVSLAARRRQPRDVRAALAGLRPAPRCRSARSPTACTRRPGWRARCMRARRARPRRRSSTDGAAWDGVDRLDDRQSGQVRRALRGRLVDEARRRLRAVVAAARRERGRARLDRRRPRPRRAHHRVRPPGAVVQAADADAARPASG